MPLRIVSEEQEITVKECVEFLEDVEVDIKTRINLSAGFVDKLFQVLYVSLHQTIDERVPCESDPLDDFLEELKDKIAEKIGESSGTVELLVEDLSEDDFSGVRFDERLKRIITRVLEIFNISVINLPTSQRREIEEITSEEIDCRISLI